MGQILKVNLESGTTQKVLEFFLSFVTFILCFELHQVLDYVFDREYNGIVHPLRKTELGELVVAKEVLDGIVCCLLDETYFYKPDAHVKVELAFV